MSCCLRYFPFRFRDIQKPNFGKERSSIPKRDRHEITLAAFGPPCGIKPRAELTDWLESIPDHARHASKPRWPPQAKRPHSQMQETSAEDCREGGIERTVSVNTSTSLNQSRIFSAAGVGRQAGESENSSGGVETVKPVLDETELYRTLIQSALAR